MPDTLGRTTETEDAPVQFECPLCFEHHEAPPSTAGRSVACQCCGASFVVPLLAGPPVPVPALPQTPPLVVTYSPEEHGGGAEPETDDERNAEDERDERDTGDESQRRSLRLSRLRQAKETRAKWSLLIKFVVVVALGIAAVVAVSAARERLAEAERRNEVQKAQPRR